MAVSSARSSVMEPAAVGVSACCWEPPRVRCAGRCGRLAGGGAVSVSLRRGRVLGADVLRIGAAGLMLSGAGGYWCPCCWRGLCDRRARLSRLPEN